MELLRITLVVILFTSLCVVRGHDLPKLENNLLLTGKDRFHEDYIDIQCKPTPHQKIQRSKTLTPSLALTAEKFGKYYFTAMSINHVAHLLTAGNLKFTFAELYYKDSSAFTSYVLQVDKQGEPAYWLPQGGYLDIPARPTREEPAKFVFTPDFTGCSWTVTVTRTGRLRIRHVRGNREAEDFNNNIEKGGTPTYAMQYKDYGYYVNITGHKIENFHGYAYMHFSNGWFLHVQRQTCHPTINVPVEGINRETGELKYASVSYDLNSSYKMIGDTTAYKLSIPNCSNTSGKGRQSACDPDIAGVHTYA